MKDLLNFYFIKPLVLNCVWAPALKYGYINIELGRGQRVNH